jgi:hypothetical protein
MTTAEQNPPVVKLTYVDAPQVLETFADSIESVHFDGQTLRIELCVTRLDPVTSQDQMSARRYPVCRLVLAVPAAIDLINKMQQIGAALLQAGVLKQAPPAPPQA